MGVSYLGVTGSESRFRFPKATRGIARIRPEVVGCRANGRCWLGPYYNGIVLVLKQLVELFQKEILLAIR